ncbi:MAG TPA: hypothetical protein PKH72_10490 [Rhodoferax sp.]|nr:hypothetical protein [Rhodoferax sp.]
MSLAHLLARHAQLTPDRDAIFNGTALHATYGQWAERSAALAHRMQAAGLVPGGQAREHLVDPVGQRRVLVRRGDCRGG